MTDSELRERLAGLSASERVAWLERIVASEPCTCRDLEQCIPQCRRCDVTEMLGRTSDYAWSLLVTLNRYMRL